jgi:hypothetical protein
MVAIFLKLSHLLFQIYAIKYEAIFDVTTGKKKCDVTASPSRIVTGYDVIQHDMY